MAPASQRQREATREPRVLPHAPEELTRGRLRRIGEGIGKVVYASEQWVVKRERSPFEIVALIVLWRFGLLRAFGLIAADIGLLLLAFGILSWFIRPGRRTVHWRDRVIDVSGGLTWMERLYYWVYKG